MKDTKRYEVPGGRIDVWLNERGELCIHGVAEFGTHSSYLTLNPEASNDLRVSLTPVKEREACCVEHHVAGLPHNEYCEERLK